MMEFLKKLLETISEFLAFLKTKQERQDATTTIKTEIAKKAEKVVKEKQKVKPKESTDENFFGD